MSRMTLSLLLLATCFPPRGVTADDERQLIQNLVQQSQRAGFERHDLQAYMSIWADDAVIIAARSLRPGPFDTLLDRDQIAATRRLRFRGQPQPNARLTFHDIETQVDGNRARLVYRARYGTGQDYLEQYLLRKTDTGWKVFENRFQLEEFRVDGQATVFNEQSWKEFDLRIAGLYSDGSTLELVGSLLQAFRLQEAYIHARRLTAAQPRSAEAWAMRGHSAMVTGRADDSLKSFRRALQLDEATVVPDWVQPAAQ